ncbi:MAG: hypothetical protein ACWGO1_15140, partial [Anaerolineales bacterium]
MRRWNLTQNTLINLTLAADVRCGGTDYSNDHIWELSLGQGDPPAVALTTTFGLRARGLRLFPRFALGDQEACDPGNFARRPVIRNFYPNFARLDFSPFPDIDVGAEFWVPQSHAILGRFWVRNLSEKPKTLQLELAAVLSPVEGQRMAAGEERLPVGARHPGLDRRRPTDADLHRIAVRPRAQDGDRRQPALRDAEREHDLLVA